MSDEQNMPDLMQRAKDYLDTDWTVHHDKRAGEWVTINEDGSNLPEHVEGAEWRVAWTRGDCETWTTWHPTIKGWGDGHGNFHFSRYWSIPHIDRRPDIPAHTAS